MAICQPRARLVNFRLSEREYDDLKKAAEDQSSRSISDFARCAILKHVAASRPALQITPEPQASDLERLENRVNEIQGAVQQIAGMLVRAAAV